MTPNMADHIDAKLRETPDLLDRLQKPILDQFFALRHAQALDEDNEWMYQNDSGWSANAEWGTTSVSTTNARPTCGDGTTSSSHGVSACIDRGTHLGPRELQC